ncbi:hypothetical protein Kisp02_46800 [Kineosporia sp. NBRC 101731]|nr:hypothetical protein Kisp02_46800 [Kineosporia sp. NBRC 101731]
MRRHFRDGEALTFDERYRYAQLPLIEPGHPLALRRSPDDAYLNGSYRDARISVVARLTVNPSLGEQATLTSFGHKIDHAMTERRKDLLHVTIAGGLDRGPAELAQALEGTAAFSMRLYGPLVGQFNSGRLYLPAVPTRTARGDAFRDLRGRLGVCVGDFFACGLLHFRDELTPSETMDLECFLQVWQREIVAENRVDELWVMSTHDDLGIDSAFVSRVELSQG